MSKQPNKNNSIIDKNNLFEQIIPSLKKEKIIISKENKWKSFEVINKQKNKVLNIKRYKRIKDNEEVYNTSNRLNDGNKRLFAFLVSGEKIRREYENKFINHMNNKLKLYTFKRKNLKSIKCNNIFNPSFIITSKFFFF